MAVDVYNNFYLNGMDWINLNLIAESSKVATPFWGKVLSVMTYCEKEWLAPKEIGKGDWNFIKKMLSEFSEVFQSTYFVEHLRVVGLVLTYLL